MAYSKIANNLNVNYNDLYLNALKKKNNMELNITSSKDNNTTDILSKTISVHDYETITDELAELANRTTVHLGIEDINFVLASFKQ